MTEGKSLGGAPAGDKLLIVDDDPVFRRVLARELGRQGRSVVEAGDSAAAMRLAREYAPAEVVLDLRIGDESGLLLLEPLVQALKLVRGDAPVARIVLLTGYASIATAVEAVKRGAHNYVAKPASVEAILDAFGDAETLPPEEPERMSVGRLEWEHIQQVLVSNDGNVSATARALNMHRRTLQRKLAKKPRAR